MDTLKSISKHWGIRVVSPEEEKEGYTVGRICRKGRL